MRKMNFGRSVFAMLLTLAIVFQMVSPIMAFAAVSDKDTSSKYTESLGDNVSTEYAGRVWTDKSVFNTDVKFDTYGGGSVTVPLESAKNEEFLISYSALATSEFITGQSQAPMDVVLILDISGSMSNGDSNMDNGRSRIYNTVQAANETIDSLMQVNPYTRVAVAVFSSNAQVLLPLGRYTKLDGYNYLSVNRQSGSNNYADLTVRANNGTGNINKTVDVEGGTNIQMGLYEGMKILADERVTTAQVNGKEMQRVPSVILLSDGSPTYSSDSRQWWAPDDNYNDGPGSAAYAGNGFKAILMGAYMKDAIDRNYKVANSAYATKVYTIGMGITGLPDTEKNLAYMTLDTGTYWNNNTNNTMKTTIKQYWSSYTANNNTGTLNINVGQMVQQGNRWVYRDKNYALTHPVTGYDLDPVNGYDYVDGYYSADNASAVNSVFQQIVTEIAISAPQVPTEIKGDDPLTDGYITYTDPIGKYMEVKDVKSIIYAGTEFPQKSVITSGNTTTYTFSGEVHSPVYGDQNIRNILITVDKDADNNEILTVKIPASVIPLRVNTVKLNADGSVKSHTNNGAFPARVIYSVGLREGIKQVSDDGHEYVDATKLSETYVKDNVNADGSINFYSNVYTNTNSVNGSTAGDAKVEFEPSHSNPFYYIQEDMPIYKDREFKQQLTAAEGLDADTVYYYKEEFYHGSDVESLAIARTGAQLTKTSIKTEAGYLYREAGSPRLNRILEFEGTKIENATGTAEDFYAPSFVMEPGSTDPFDGKFVIYHGNNGKLSLAAGGNLEIRKQVTANQGLTAPEETFTFTLDLDAEKINGGSYIYVIRDSRQNQVSQGTVSAASPTISLADGQIATVYALPPQTTYTVTEAAADGFSTEAVGASGTIHAGLTQQVVFTNNYSVKPVTSEKLEGKKNFTGRSWQADDSFTFFLTPFNNCPLPEGYDPDAGVTVTGPDTPGGSEASFEFGAIEFTAPGLYRYTVVEKEPQSDGYLPGLTYSRSLYRIAIVVEDNHDGTLKITSTDIQRLYDDAATPLFTYGNQNQIVMNPGEEAKDEIVFTNTYKANSVIRVPVALKAYSDPSGTKPLVSGMFDFRLKAVGYSVDGGELLTDITNVPMPAGSVNGEIVTTNEGHDITFPSVEFTQELIPVGAEYITYRYEMSEVIPKNKVPGMTYDEKVYTVDVKVEIDHTSSDLLVSAIYPGEERIATFTNSFRLEPVTADIDGSKTLNGRDMLSGEAFAFTLVGANAPTNNAVRDGIVVVPESEVSVKGGKNGEAKKFSFADIQFNKPGTYTFLVSETDGGAPAVFYDNNRIAVTFEIADKNGDAKLEVVSTTYSNGKQSADFVNTYTYGFSEPPVNLTGTKNLTGKSLLDGEFFFRMELYRDDKLIDERLVGHAGDETATDGVYSGEIVFLKDVTYSAPGTYVYLISEQIPEDGHKVQGTEYDESQYRFTVVVEDDGQGNLVIDPDTNKLEKKNGNSWKSVQSIEFNNAYVPEPTTISLPLIKKVISGDRNKAMEENEFYFQMKVVSATDPNGITLPAQATVGNAENGDVTFGGITFSKAGEYTVSVQEVIPDDADKVPGITYSTRVILATFDVKDDRNGQLTAALVHMDADTFINKYQTTGNDAEIHGIKQLIGMDMVADLFSFSLYETDDTYNIDGVTALATVKNAVNGSFVFNGDNVPELYYTAPDTHYYVLVEDNVDPIADVRYDTRAYQFKVTVEDNGEGALTVVVDCVNGDENNIVFTNVTHDEIVKKQVCLAGDRSVMIDGQKVNHGQILEYVISYKNYTGEAATVTITDIIPANTTLVSAENGGTVNNGVVTWNLENVAPGAQDSVSFKVAVESTAQLISNQATVVEGTNRYQTNIVTNSVVPDRILKDVFAQNDTNMSIHNKKVAVGDVLVYKITYTNTNDQIAQITITDKLPAHAEFVSVEDNGEFKNGTVTWQFPLGAGQSKTVTFRVKVIAPDVFIDNQAFGTENGYTIESNVVTNYTYEEAGQKDVVMPDAPQVSIDGQMVEIGQELIYVINYTNITSVPVDMTITDTIPAHTALVDGSVSEGGKITQGVITWQFNALKPRETASVSFHVVVTEPGDAIENQAMIFDGTNKVTNAVVNSVPEKQVDKQTASHGDVLTYTINYVNKTGASADVVITDTLGAALRFVENSASNGGKHENGVVTWELKDVPAGERISVSFQAVIVKEANAQEITNVAKITENDVRVAETNKTVTDVLDPELKIRKEQAVGKGKTTTDKLAVKAGDVVTYTITVTNVGEGIAWGITVADQLPAGLKYVNASANRNGQLIDGNVVWTVDKLEAGKSLVLTFCVEVPKVEVNTNWINVAAFAYENDSNDDESTKSNQVEIKLKVPVTPQTGDDSNAVLFICLMALSSFGVAAMSIAKKRLEKEEATAE